MITLANPASVTCAHAALRDALLPNLISGGLRVKNIEEMTGRIVSWRRSNLHKLRQTL